MNTKIIGKTFDAERALYNLRDADIENCTFAGLADGESVLKEAKNIALQRCAFSLRYPLWHVEQFSLKESTMDELTRAAIWYSSQGSIEHCKLYGIKAVRECSTISLSNCDIKSPEFGWKCQNISIDDCDIEAEYLFLDSSEISMRHSTMKGKYSFQYISGLTIEDCQLDTKDAFWHSSNVTVRDSLVKGEYLGWFSENLTLINCHIIGTQPLCYCKGLRLIACTMEDCDLAFEYSEVEADIKGNIASIKNPLAGSIVVDSVGEIIREDSVRECSGRVAIRGQLELAL